jgi:hypothetical protein
MFSYLLVQHELRYMASAVHRGAMRCSDRGECNAKLLVNTGSSWRINAYLRGYVSSH